MTDVVHDRPGPAPLSPAPPDPAPEAAPEGPAPVSPAPQGSTPVGPAPPSPPLSTLSLGSAPVGRWRGGAAPGGRPSAGWSSMEPRPAGRLSWPPVVDTRHPQDPEPTRSTKAAAVLALGVAAVVTGPFVGGIVPATIGLALAREARADLVAGRGYLTGARRLQTGRLLAVIGLGLAVTALVTATVVLLISMANGGPLLDVPATAD